MNYLGPRQRQSDLRWNYTSRNGPHIKAIGYCSGSTNEDKYHTDGHTDADSACLCYKEYILDNLIQTIELEEPIDCSVCGIPCKIAISVNNYNFPLCEEHCNRGEVSKLFEIWRSTES